MIGIANIIREYALEHDPEFKGSQAVSTSLKLTSLMAIGSSPHANSALPATLAITPVPTRLIILRSRDSDALEDVTSEAGRCARTLAQLPAPPARNRDSANSGEKLDRK